MKNNNKDLFGLDIDADGIVTMIIDQKDNPTNLFSTTFINAFIGVCKEVIANDSLTGMVVTSGRSMFMPGADLRELKGMGSNPEKQFNDIMEMHQSFREVEKGGKPIVAAINGTAMGGGLELCLICHHRIVLDNHRIKLGFPESKVGLLPGGGGTIKAPYLMGVQNGLMYLLQGKEVRPQQALKDGLVNDMASSQEELITKSKEWIKNNPTPVQPWDNKKYRIPGGSFWTPNSVQTIMGAVGNVSKMTHGNYPAQKYILSTIHDGLQIPVDKAFEVEARYFVKLLGSKEAQNMIRTGFMGMQAAKKGKARPKNEAKFEIRKLGILGAGMMGAGIAYVSAKAGMEVVLKDVTLENAEKGKAYSKKILDKAISKGRSTPEKAEALLSKITTTANAEDMAGCDMVIEAVFEDPNLKDKVTKETEAVLDGNSIYASNTSTIPITLLAKSSQRPKNFIGIHFFSPVDKMPLVEIIVGEETSPKAIAAAIDYTVAIRKIPIVVNDSRGFFTSRCFSTFVNEGMFLLEEGVPAAMIENIAKKKGMPVGPLAVHDEVTLTLSEHIIQSNPDIDNNPELQRAYKIVKSMISNGRTSKKDGAGFYDYPTNAKKKLWSELGSMFKANLDALDKDTTAKRMMHIQALESFRCLDEGVLNSVTDGDIGSVLGWGFPIYTGGALSYIDFVGMSDFISDCDEFKSRFGNRWTVPQSLRDLAEAGKSIHDFKRVVKHQKV